MDDSQIESAFEMLMEIVREDVERDFLESVGLSGIDRKSTLLVFRDCCGELAFCTHKGLVPTKLTSLDQLGSEEFRLILTFPQPLRLADLIVVETKFFPNGLAAALEGHVVYKRITQEDLDKEDLETLKKDFAAKSGVSTSKVETLQVKAATTTTTPTTDKTIH